MKTFFELKMVYAVASSAEFKEIIKGDLVIVDFTATWCGPCKMIGPYFDELSKRYEKAKFIKVDVDELDDVASEAGVSAMPSFYVYKNGKVVDQMVGASKEKLEQLCEKYCK